MKGKEKVGEAFEKLTATIQAALRINENYTVKHNISISEAPGLNAAIDVYIEGAKRIIVECKDKSKPATLAEMRVLADVCRNNNAEGIFVSKKGFQKGAKLKAIQEGIEMFTLDTINSEDLRNGFKIPITKSLKPNWSCSNIYFLLDPIYEDLLPVVPDDKNIYFGLNKVCVSCLEFASHSVNDNMKMLFIDLFEEFYSTFNMELIGKDNLSRLEVNLREETNILFQGEFIPVTKIYLEINRFITIQEKIDSELYLNKNVLGNIVSETSVSPAFDFRGNKYRLNIVNPSDNTIPISAYLVPSTRSSEIIELEDVGVIRKSENHKILIKGIRKKEG